MSEIDLRSTVRSAYRKIALEAVDACGVAGCCMPDEVAAVIGYTDAQLAALPEGANMGLGCGNPLALASLTVGEVVLDLGSGAGIDCFLAAQAVGATGHVIGVDMTPEMLARANAHLAASGLTNIEFREGQLEALPVDDASVDLVISNCVINLVPDRARVYEEAMRVLRPGGRISVSDTIQTLELPAALLETEAAKAACISASVTKEVYLGALTDAGFVEVTIESEVPYPADLGFEQALFDGLRDEQGIPEAVIRAAAGTMVAIAVTARRPA
jgi:ubiquinone/menaquinone biosynthesis C-methylase UbiE